MIDKLIKELKIMNKVYLQALRRTPYDNQFERGWNCGRTTLTEAMIEALELIKDGANIETAFIEIMAKKDKTEVENKNND